MKYFLVLLLIFLLAGCESDPAGLKNVEKDSPHIGAAKIEKINELAKEGNEFYSVKEIVEKDGSIEIKLHLLFNPTNFPEVMVLTDPLAEAAAALFDFSLPVGVSAFFTISGSDEIRLFGESLFIPETGKTHYKPFGRDHVLGYGDP